MQKPIPRYAIKDVGKLKRNAVSERKFGLLLLEGKKRKHGGERRAGKDLDSATL